jgi:hypothetical protein
VWIAAPIAAGFAWHRLTPRQSLVVAVVVGATVSLAAAFLFWQAVAYPDCVFGQIRTPGDWILPSLTLGGVIGGGLAASGLLASNLAREGRPRRAVVLGAGMEVVMVIAAIAVLGLVSLVPLCERPV